MKSKSAAAANLCSFVVNVYTYNRIYVKVREGATGLGGGSVAERPLTCWSSS